MIRLLFHLRGISLAGTEIAVYNLISYLGKMGKYDITIGYENEDNSKIMVDRLSQYATVKRITEAIDTDILIYCFYDIEKGEQDVINKITRKKTIFWNHFFGKNCILKNEKFCADLERIICVSEPAKDFLLDWEPLARSFEDIIEVLPNVLPVEEIKEKAKEKVSLDFTKPLNLVTIARINPGKGYDRMLKMVEILEKRGIDYQWYIIGEEYNNDVVRNGIIQKFKPYPAVQFLGELANPYAILANSDYLVLLSESETYSFVAAEARVLGIPCIVTNFQTATLFVEDGKNGIILDKDDTSKYESKLQHIVEDKLKFKEYPNTMKMQIDQIITRWKELLRV